MRINILILLQIFIVSQIIYKPMFANTFQFFNLINKMRTEIEKTELELQDENLSLELWNSLEIFYDKIIDTTALYFTGIIQNSTQFYKELIFQTGKYLISVAHILAHYAFTLFKNPKISWYLKIKRFSCIMAFLTTVLLWMKEIYQPEIINYRPNLIPFSNIFQNVTPYLLQPRNRPSLN